MEQLTRDEIIAFVGSRKNTYDLLAKVYHNEVDAEFLDKLAETPLPCLNDKSLQDAGYARLRTFLRNRDSDSTHAINGEFCGMILGAGATDLEQMASPYESVYTSEEQLLMQDARDQIVAMYASEGISVKNENNEPEDHISFEFSFVGILYQRCHEALLAGNDAKAEHYLEVLRTLFTDHLCVWVIDFCRDIARLAQTAYFRAFCRITAGIVNDEPAYIAMCQAALDPSAEPYEAAFLDETAFDDVASDGPENEAEPELTEEEKRERAANLFSKMDFMRRPFIRILKYCLEPRTTDELQAETEEILRYIKSAYGPVEVRHMLNAAYCLDQARVSATEMTSEQAEAETAGEDADAKAKAEVEATGKDADAKTAGEDAAQIMTQDSEDEVELSSANEEGTPDYYTVWQTTEIGKEYIVEEDPIKAIKELFAQDKLWLSGYEKTLTTLKNGAGTFKEVQDVIKPMELYQKDNKHAAMFLKRLEDAGAIEWKDKWVLTDAGEATLAKMLDKAAK